MANLSDTIAILADCCKIEIKQVRMSAEQDEYHENCHRLQRRATRLCNAGVIVLKRASGTMIAIPEGNFAKLPATLVLARAKVTFRATSEKIRLDFKNLTPETERLAIRYL